MKEFTEKQIELAKEQSIIVTTTGGTVFDVLVTRMGKYIMTGKFARCHSNGIMLAPAKRVKMSLMATQIATIK